MYCTYLTIYRGNKLPPFYIGSCKLINLQKGYKGSVSSKKYRDIWIQELKDNPQSFKIKIISIHNTNIEVKQKELYFHEKLNVVKSNMYINLSKARINGFFGMDVSGKNNPMFGKSRKENHPKGMKNKKHSEITKSAWSKIRKGKNLGASNPMFGKQWSPETRNKILSKRTGQKRGKYKIK